jgi:hypothetical protein
MSVNLLMQSLKGTIMTKRNLFDGLRRGGLEPRINPPDVYDEYDEEDEENEDDYDAHSEEMERRFESQRDDELTG